MGDNHDKFLKLCILLSCTTVHVLHIRMYVCVSQHHDIRKNEKKRRIIIHPKFSNVVIQLVNTILLRERRCDAKSDIKKKLVMYKQFSDIQIYLTGVSHYSLL